MTITLSADRLDHALESAYILATSDAELPPVWIERAERLGESPSVAFVAAVGAVLLAKAANDRVDAFVIKSQEGSSGAFSLRRAATALARKRRAFGYDIGSSSDQDPINHSTLNGFTRWDLALGRITAGHKPFFQVILQWLPDINDLDEQQATEALAAYIRVRRAAAPGGAVEQVPDSLNQPPALSDLVQVLDGFVAADPENGARGMALVAAAFRAAGLEADVPSRNDPRRIDIPIKRHGTLVIGSEVKQLKTAESTADTLVSDVVDHGVRRALLVVLRPGTLGLDRTTVIRRAELERGVVLRITDGTRELLHEAISASDVEIDAFCSALPRAFAEALRDIRVADASIDTWAAIARRWASPSEAAGD